MLLLGACAAGLAAGLLAGAFGIGGGIVLVPALTLLLGIGQHEAQGTTLAAMLLPIGLPAVLTYHRAHPIRVRLAALVAAGFLPGVWAGSRAAVAVPDRAQRALFVLFLLFAAWRLWPARRRAAPRERPAPEAHGLWIGLVAGLLAGLFGVGGGILMVPLLVWAMGLTQHEAQATSLAVMLPPIGLPGVWVYARSGGLPWAVLLAVAGGFLGGALGGARVATRVDGARLARAFSAFVLSTAAVMGWRVLRG